MTKPAIFNGGFLKYTYPLTGVFQNGVFHENGGFQSSNTPLNPPFMHHHPSTIHHIKNTHPHQQIHTGPISIASHTSLLFFTYLHIPIFTQIPSSSHHPTSLTTFLNMSNQTSRQQVENAKKLTELLLLFDSHSDSDSDSNLESTWLALNSLLAKQYMVPRIHTLHNPMYERQKLHLIPDLSFQQLFRTLLPSFMKLLAMIEDHHIFQNNSRNPQRDPAIQLAVALCRLGSNGNGAAIHRLENLFSVSYGSIDLYTKRVMIAILSFRRLVLSWPTKEERKEISQVMETEGFPGCIGFVDGTTIPLSQKPNLDGNHYFDCKKRQLIHFFSNAYDKTLDHTLTKYVPSLCLDTPWHYNLFAITTRSSSPSMLAFQVLVMIHMFSIGCGLPNNQRSTLTKINTFWPIWLMLVGNM